MNKFCTYFVIMIIATLFCLISAFVNYISRAFMNAFFIFVLAMLALIIIRVLLKRIKN